MTPVRNRSAHAYMSLTSACGRLWSSPISASTVHATDRIAETNPMKYLSFIAFACACMLVPIASANSVDTLNSATSPNASLKTNSFTLVSRGLAITSARTENLYYKSTRGMSAETGLGLTCCDGNYEIGSAQSIALNLSNRFSQHVNGIILVVESIQSAETGQICDSVGLCATISSSQNANTVSTMSLYKDMKAHHSEILAIKAGNGDVVLNQFDTTTSAVPEPRGLLLMGTGLVLLAGGLRRKLHP